MIESGGPSRTSHSVFQVNRAPCGHSLGTLTLRDTLGEYLGHTIAEAFVSTRVLLNVSSQAENRATATPYGRQVKMANNAAG
jgi:hypothetical protein